MFEEAKNFCPPRQRREEDRIIAKADSVARARREKQLMNGCRLHQCEKNEAENITRLAKARFA